MRVGFELLLFGVDDPAFVAASGKALHNTLRRTGSTEDRVAGVAQHALGTAVLYSGFVVTRRIK